MKPPNLERGFGCFLLLFLASLGSLPAFGATITVTNTSDSGAGSLRDAIESAAPGDTITFGVTGIITLSQRLFIGKSLTISGPGASTLAISGNRLTRVIYVDTGVTVAISSLTIRDGNTNGEYWGGAVLNWGGTLSLDHVVATGNFGSQGAILNVAGSLTLTNSTLSGNSADYYGGGIENSRGGPPGSAMVTVINSTISSNHANAIGGGIANGPDTTMMLINSTVAANTSNYSGGGIGNGGTMMLISSTIWGNSAGAGGGIHTPGAPLKLKNVINANNSGGNCLGVVTSLGHNLSDDVTCALNGSGDLDHTPAQLDPGGLRNNGGPTQTVAPLSTSPTFNAVPLSYCTDAFGALISTDQRGISRPQGIACDIGSVEQLVQKSYDVCLLYDLTRAVNSGATLPVKLYLCDGVGKNLSASSIVLHSTGITKTSSSTTGPVLDSGNSNPDNDFRFDSSLSTNGGYVFNLSTRGLTTGTYNLNFTVTGDSFVYVAPFQVK